jgi:hypothetical protein
MRRDVRSTVTSVSRFSVNLKLPQAFVVIVAAKRQSIVNQQKLRIQEIVTRYHAPSSCGVGDDPPERSDSSLVTLILPADIGSCSHTPIYSDSSCRVWM